MLNLEPLAAVASVVAAELAWASAGPNVLHLSGTLLSPPGIALRVEDLDGHAVPRTPSEDTHLGTLMPDANIPAAILTATDHAAVAVEAKRRGGILFQARKRARGGGGRKMRARTWVLLRVH